jgi:hypothetical protein
MKLKPIGKGSSADSLGYSFSLLVSWLEDIRDSELEKADTKPAYLKRAEELDTLVCRLSDLE